MLKHPLEVHRRLSNGKVIKVGELAENKTGIYFQYEAGYLKVHKTISPFALPASTELHKGPSGPHKKLHGVFADSLPDGWGLNLMARVFRKNGYNPETLSQLERLAFIGDNCLGALFYVPRMTLEEEQHLRDLSIWELGQLAVGEFEGTESDLVEHLMDTAGSGGARLKINATLLSDGSYTTDRRASGKHCIINLPQINLL